MPIQKREDETEKMPPKADRYAMSRPGTFPGATLREQLIAEGRLSPVASREDDELTPLHRVAELPVVRIDGGG